MAVFPWQKTEKNGTEEFTLPDDLQKKIDDGANAAAELPKIRELLEGLNNVMATQTAEQKAREAAAKRAEQQQQQQQNDGTLEEQIEELMLAGQTKKAVALATQGQTSEILLLRADRIKRELFEDEKKFKYYHGDLKKEVDALINGQTLQARNDPSVVENCYKTVLGNHTDELLEGKIKSRFAGSENDARGTSIGAAGSSGSGEHKKYPVTDDVRKAAKLLGFTPEDYAEMLDKDGVGYA